MRDVTAHLRSSGRAEADQGAVWDAVASELAASNVSSPTGALSALFDQQQTLESFVEAFAPVESQVGAVFCVDGRVAGLELFDSATAYAASAPKLIRCYAHGVTGGSTPAPSEVDAASFLHSVGHVPATVHDAPGAGVHVRLEDEGVVGAALVHAERVLHLIAFAASPADGDAREVWPDDSTPYRRVATAADLIRTGRMRCEQAPILSRTPAPLDRSGTALRDRVEGMLLGLAIGDALGNTTESLTRAQRRRRHGEVRDYLPNVHAGGAFGVPSDDTQMAFWTLRRLPADGELKPARLAREFCRHRIFGIGRTVRAFIRSHKDDGMPWWQAGQHTAGNGALMRIAPVLLPHLAQPSRALWSDVAIAAMITHNERAAIGSCVALVEMLWALLRRDAPPPRGWWVDGFTRTLREVEGDVPRYAPRAPGLTGPVTLWSFTRRHLHSALDRDLDTAAACDGWYSGAYLLETVPSVLYILERHGHDPEEAIVRAVNDTKDNDTVAAIVGAAVGALHGRSALPARWVEGLLGRTGEDDDGEVFRMIDAACARFVT